MYKKKIIVYGLGKEYEKQMWFLKEEFNIVGYSDGKKAAVENYILPDELRNCDWDYIYITSSKYINEIKEELINRYLIEENKIISKENVLGDFRNWQAKSFMRVVGVTMKEKEEVVIVIPIYREKITPLEQVSLTQVINILGEYDICFIIPQSLKWESEYKIRIEKFADNFFTSRKAYNRLLLSVEFYKRFENYEYILIYQLDAFVFSNQLKYFCNLKYDYIGAPWICGMQYYLNKKNCIWHVGNGGFSLRRVSSCIKLICTNYELVDVCSKLNEDLFFAMGNSISFKVAPIEVALTFAFERQVEKCYLMNKQKLPFGCHAWERYDFKFWKPFIEQYGYQVNLESHEMGKDDEKLSKEYEVQTLISNFMEYKYDAGVLLKVIQQVAGRKVNKCVIWGAGYYGREICKLLEGVGIEIKGVVDNNVNLHNQLLENYNIFSFDAYKKMPEHFTVIIAMKRGYEEVAKQMEAAGFKYKRDYMFCMDIIKNLIELTK